MSDNRTAGRVEPTLVCLADIEPAAVKWLWPGRIPLGRITLLVGRPGEGKSFLTLDMAARVTTGRPWPDGSDCPPGCVILVSVEDDPADTVRPRLDAARADVSKVHLLTGVRCHDGDGTTEERMFSLGNLPALEAALQVHPDCKLVVVDPIGSFLGGQTDAHRDNEVRSVLAPVAKLARDFGPAVVVVAHRRKSAGNMADDLALGSRAFTGIARAVWHLTHDTEDKSTRLLLPGKSNLASEGEGLAFKIMGTPPAVAWAAEPVHLTADDALAAENARHDVKRPGPKPRARNAAERWLASLLAGKELKAGDVQRESEAAGLVWRTVQRAADCLGVSRTKGAFEEGWWWRMPNEDASPRRQVPPEQEDLAS